MMNKSLFDHDHSKQLEAAGSDERHQDGRVASRMRRGSVAKSSGQPTSTSAPSCSYGDSYQQNDVLFGRGGLTNHHPGNQVYRRTIENGKPEYKSLKSSADKRVFLNKIYTQLKEEHGARFLMKQQKKSGTMGGSKTMWYEVPKTKALSKIRQALTEAHYQKKDRKDKGNRKRNSKPDAADKSPRSLGQAKALSPPPNSPSENEKTTKPFVPDPNVFVVQGGEWASSLDLKDEKSLLDSFEFDLNSSGQFSFLDEDFITDESDNSVQLEESSVESNLSNVEGFAAYTSDETEELLKDLEERLTKSLPASPAKRKRDSF